MNDRNFEANLDPLWGQRIDAYVDLIRALLDSQSNEQQEQILQSNQELIDAGLVLIANQVARIEEQQGNSDRAHWLQQFAMESARVMGKASSSDNVEEYYTFLMQVLFEIAKNRANPRSVYPTLQSNLDKLDDFLAQLLWSWGRSNLPEIELEEVRTDVATDIMNFSILMSHFQQGNRASNLEIALAGYRVVATVFTPEAYPEEWADIQNNLGTVYHRRVRGEPAKNLEAAIEHYQAALKVYTHEAFPEEWAMIQNNLADVYQNKMGEDRSKNIEKAIAILESMLPVCTGEAFLEKWAMTQNNLGNAYRQRIQGNPSENLEKAIAAYKSALPVYTQEKFPLDWAMTQNNLAIAYRHRLEDRDKNLEKAIDIYKALLQVYKKEEFPEEWARTQYNLGFAYKYRLGDLSEDWELAIAAFEEAFKVYTQEAFPQQYSTIQDNLDELKKRLKINTDTNAQKWLEIWQQQKYEKRGGQLPSQASHYNLKFDKEMLEKQLNELASSMSEEEISNLRDEILKTLEVQNKIELPTRFEDYRTHSIVTTLGKEIEDAAQALSIPLPDKILYGTLPTGQVNALTTKVSSKEYLVLFESEFFTFALLMSKVVTRAMPFTGHQEGEKSAFSTSETDINQTLIEHPEILRRFQEVIIAYLIDGKPSNAPQYFLEGHYGSIASYLLRSMELFVVGHELGHIICGHIGKPNSWQQEIEADMQGLELMLQAMRKKGLDLALSFWGADFFFSCFEMVDRGRAIINYGDENNQPRSDHPPAKIRREMLRDVLKRSVPEETSKAPIKLAMTLERVMDTLWNQTQPLLQKYYESKQKPTPI